MNSGTLRSLMVYCAGPEQAMLRPDPGNELLEGDVHIWFAPFSEVLERTDEFHQLLDAREKERAARFRFDRDRDRFVVANGLLRTVLGTYMGQDPKFLGLRRGPFGKPFVEGSALHFNLSDTKDAVIVALSRTDVIGTDIETMARTVDHLAVGDHYFTAEEMVGIREANDGKRRFLELWTRKEAVLKASGVGIMEDLRVLRVDAPMNRIMIGHEAFTEYAADSYHVGTWHLGEAHLVSMASPVPIRTVSFRSFR